MRGSKGQRIVDNKRLNKKSVASYWVGSYDCFSKRRNRQNSRNRRWRFERLRHFIQSSCCRVQDFDRLLISCWGVSVFMLVASESPDVESSKFGVGERRRFLVFLVTLFGERCQNPLARTLPSSKLWWSYSCFVISMLQTFQKTRC
jgi:hypothetical protein